jgi:hypothetical protein
MTKGTSKEYQIMIKGIPKEHLRNPTQVAELKDPLPRNIGHEKPIP